MGSDKDRVGAGCGKEEGSRKGGETREVIGKEKKESCERGYRKNEMSYVRFPTVSGFLVRWEPSSSSGKARPRRK